MKINPSKKSNLYTQGQHSVARMLFIWLLTSCSPEGVLATSKCEVGTVPVNSRKPHEDDAALNLLLLKEQLSKVRSSCENLVARSWDDLQAEQARILKFRGALEHKASVLQAEQAQVSTLQDELKQKERELRSLQSALEKARFGDCVLGPSVWERYFGHLGTCPALPADIEGILNSPCPFWQGKQVKDTHLLVLIPKQVNDQALTLNYLGKLIQQPQNGGHATRYKHYDPDICRDLGSKDSGGSYWVLMTRDVLEGSRNNNYKDQCTLVENYAKRTGLAYKLPKTLEAAIVILLHHVESGKRLYGDNPPTLTHCSVQDPYSSPMTVGWFSEQGLQICENDHGSYERDGAAVLRRFDGKSLAEQGSDDNWSLV